MIKAFISSFLILILALFDFACTPDLKAVKPNEATHEIGQGKLITSEGYKFPYRFYPATLKGPSVIYLPGMDGRDAYGGGQGVYALASLLNNANFNLVGFNRADAKSSYGVRSVEVAFRNTVKRSKSGSVYFPSIDGKESATEDIIQNEISAIIKFVERAPTHDPEKGIYLIGASHGSWVSLGTVHSFPDKIKGVVFLTPGFHYGYFSPKWQAKYPEQNITNYFNSLIRSFGARPALAIGSKRDIIAPQEFKDGSALDGARLLEEELGPNVEVMEVSSSLHQGELIEGSLEVRKKIVSWLEENAYSE